MVITWMTLHFPPTKNINPPRSKREHQDEGIQATGISNIEPQQVS